MAKERGELEKNKSTKGKTWEPEEVMFIYYAVQLATTANN